ncbi:hypothetical protein JCM19037_2097 [Geomicrobium sp. JCM 19037]|uniref:hypothetical protein n=1 Tax=Geomicrobium sp. JCM 19037 TaxID=1460634 RepID=UPI00045F2945|nr:hypothetical protein [Geomicrobium sp. JCM 19037]GAK03752.1 hypothetical protein JCM19037_2097 [Geomicrobium sp. JCM 19037]
MEYIDVFDKQLQHQGVAPVVIFMSKLMASDVSLLVHNDAKRCGVRVVSKTLAG